MIEKGEFEDDYLAEQASDEFLDFAKLRSIYFENKFTHKTFLEYFTAYYIYSYYYGNWKKAREFSELIQNYTGLSAWSVVLELLICKIDFNQINFDVVDDLVEELFEKNKLDTLIFFLQILKYLKNISPKKIKFLIDKAIEYCFKDGLATKEGKSDHKEVLFSQICILGNIERFSLIIESSFSEYINASNTSVLHINAFAYEFAIVSGNTSLVKILQAANQDSTSEYIFILKHYPSLFDNVSYKKSLEVFFTNYPNSTPEVYRSIFRQRIFFNSEYFNWCVTYISKNINQTSIYKLYNELLEAGIPKDILHESAKKISASIDVYDFQKNIASVTEKDSSYKRFISSLNRTYFEEKQKRKDPSSKFYDRFYVSKGKIINRKR